MSSSAATPTLQVENRIYAIRGQKVLLDSDLVSLYNVPTGRLNEAVKRNRERRPDDFMFQLTLAEGRELESLRSQFAILNSKRGRHRKYMPYAFTEHGVAMLSSVLHSPAAIQVNIDTVRTFIRLRALIAGNEEFAQRLQDLEWRQGEQASQIQQVF